MNIYTETEFCKLVGIGLSTAFRLRNKGKLQHIRIGKQIKYTTAHIEAFLAAHECNQPKTKVSRQITGKVKGERYA